MVKLEIISFGHGNIDQNLEKLGVGRGLGLISDGL